MRLMVFMGVLCSLSTAWASSYNCQGTKGFRYVIDGQDKSVIVIDSAGREKSAAGLVFKAGSGGVLLAVESPDGDPVAEIKAGDGVLRGTFSQKIFESGVVDSMNCRASRTQLAMNPSLLTDVSCYSTFERQVTNRVKLVKWEVNGLDVPVPFLQIDVFTSRGDLLRASVPVSRFSQTERTFKLSGVTSKGNGVEIEISRLADHIRADGHATASIRVNGQEQPYVNLACRAQIVQLENLSASCGQGNEARLYMAIGEHPSRAVREKAASLFQACQRKALGR